MCLLSCRLRKCHGGIQNAIVWDVLPWRLADIVLDWQLVAPSVESPLETMCTAWSKSVCWDTILKTCNKHMPKLHHKPWMCAHSSSLCAETSERSNYEWYSNAQQLHFMNFKIFLHLWLPWHYVSCFGICLQTSTACGAVQTLKALIRSHQLMLISAWLWELIPKCYMMIVWHLSGFTAQWWNKAGKEWIQFTCGALLTATVLY